MGRSDSNAKREHLLDIAAERFLASGFSAVSVDELVASAGQSKTNVYSWFGGKEGLFLATIDRLLDAMLVPLIDNRFAAAERRPARACGCRADNRARERCVGFASPDHCRVAGIPRYRAGLGRGG